MAIRKCSALCHSGVKHIIHKTQHGRKLCKYRWVLRQLESHTCMCSHIPTQTKTHTQPCFFAGISELGWMNNGLSRLPQLRQGGLDLLEFGYQHYQAPPGPSRHETGTLTFGAIRVLSSSVVLVMVWLSDCMSLPRLWQNHRTFSKWLTTKSPLLVSGSNCFICANNCPSWFLSLSPIQ